MYRIVNEINARHIKILADGFLTYQEATEYVNNYWYDLNTPNVRIESSHLISESDA